MTRIKAHRRATVTFVMVALLLFPLAALATNPPVNILDSVTQLFQQDLQSISASLNTYAQRLFLGLAVIGLVWSCGFMILEGADLGKFFATFIRWIVFVGFFWWLTQNGPAMASSIINSFAQIGASTNGVTGAQQTLGPSSPINMAMLVDQMVESKISSWHPIDSLGLIILDLVILLTMCVVSANMLITLCTCWVIIYAGQILLGFGALKWTSDIAVNYFRTVLGIAVTYMTMIILVSIALKFFQQMVNGFGTSDFSYQQMFILIVCGFVLAFLVHKIPPLVGAITGNHGGAHGSFGVGAAIGIAAGVAAAGGAALAAQASSMAGASGGGGGGMSALMNAVRAGGDAAGAGGSDGAAMADSMGAANDSGGQGGSALAAAMGDGGGMSAVRSSSGGSSSSRPRSFGQGAAALAHAGVSAMDSAVGGSGYNGALAPSGGGRSQSGGAQGVAGQGGNASSDASAPASSSVADDTPAAPATDQPAPTPADESTVTDARPAPAAAAARQGAATPATKPDTPIFNGDFIAANDNDSASEIAAFVNKQTPAA
jgi:type IV secretion system protein TrbL